MSEFYSLAYRPAKGMAKAAKSFSADNVRTVPYYPVLMFRAAWKGCGSVKNELQPRSNFYPMLIFEALRIKLNPVNPI